MVIVGLGNPGKKYNHTPHNLGFVVLDRFVADRDDTSWQTEGQVEYAKLGSHWLIKPQSYMNTSGQALKAFCDYRKIPFQAEDWWIVHDDIDLPPGTLRPDVNRSSGGHQGVQSIIDAFQSQAFHRLRIGIGSNRDLAEPIPAETYVLQPIREEFREAIERSVAEAVEFIKQRLG